MGLFFRELASFKCVAKIDDFLLVAKEKIKIRKLFSGP
jgi:hypothetical protein